MALTWRACVGGGCARHDRENLVQRGRGENEALGDPLRASDRRPYASPAFAYSLHCFSPTPTLTRFLHNNTVHQGFPDRGPRAQILAPDRLILGPLGLKYMHWIWAFGP